MPIRAITPSKATKPNGRFSASKAAATPTMPKGLPPIPDTSKATIAVFVAHKQWEKVEAALKADPQDEVIVEGYPVNDAKNQLTGLWAQSCSSKNLQRAKREAQSKE